MVTALMVLHAIISVLLILLVLLQFGKGAEAGLISGGASDAVMSGAQRGNVLSKITAVLAVIFMANSVILAKLQSKKSSSSLLDTEEPVSRPLNFDAQRKKAKEAQEKMKEGVQNKGMESQGQGAAPKADSQADTKKK